MDTTNLTAFLAIVDTGSFSEAGEKLFLTQPAVSKRIAALEEQLGCSVFDRIGRQVTLNEAGKVLLPRARRMMELVHDTKLEIINLSGEVKGPLSIATSHHIGLRRLPGILKNFTRAFPEVKLDIRFVDSEASYEMLSRGEIELGIITLSPENQPAIHSEKLWHDPLGFMAAKDHPLTKLKNVSTEQLSQYQAVLPGRNTFTYQVVQHLFDQEGLKLQTAMSTNYLETLRMLAAIGLAWCILPLTMQDNDLGILNVKLKGTVTPPSRELGYILHSKRTLSNAASAFVELLQQHKDDA
ncbi:LysR family transcriptional regulator [Endozoicomonas elysicola]|uniref:LysR family transcriptional regulator n=1 Tax=Endozoicomonas elysicola TaxID=305900 RepID=A0A081KCU8_9GAMM|nr:LysR family transcriptional regulator [Endozoicomonas elysicola]KEI71974.1 LysR family transcriptional regulator [Endozoicomonas elysicola]